MAASQYPYFQSNPLFKLRPFLGMDRLYILAVLSIVGDPPNSNKMEVVRGDYTFMPFGGSQICTMDGDVWKAAGARPELVLFPNSSECNAAIQKALDPSVFVLMGLVGERMMDVPGQGLTNLEPLQLGDKYRTLDAGYDVTDPFGLSAISNIGYSTDDTTAIRNLGITVTEYGLIHSESDSRRLADFADSHVEEHAPFRPVRIMIIQPR